MCLCGMLAAEYETLPEPMQEALTWFFDDGESWLTGVLEQGAAEGTVRLTGSARDTARTIVSGLEGAMLTARPFGDAERFDSAAERLLATLTGAEPAAARRARAGG